MTEMVEEIPTAAIFGNPKQPRQTFDQAELEDLAASIRERGQLQPCVVVKAKRGKYMLVAGERRWRAQQLNAAPTTPCLVREKMEPVDILVDAIIENRQRVDVTPLEEARAFQQALDLGMTSQQLADKVGLQQAWRVTERTCLLELRPEYLALLERKQLTASQSYEMAQLSPNGQDALFRAIRRGECATYGLLRSTALVLRDAESQLEFETDERTEATANERQLAKGLERRINQVAAVLRASVIDNEIVAARKVDPTRAGTMADLLTAMVGDLQRIAAGLRAVATVDA